MKIARTWASSWSSTGAVVATFFGCVGLVLLPVSALANPINGQFYDGGCDAVANQPHTEELGLGPLSGGPFPPNEEILVSVQPGPLVCVVDDGLPNDWQITITNFSGQDWKNLFFVADNGVGLGNADGNSEDFAAPGTLGESFRIDGTVTAGINSNLISESGIVDEIFQAGETWVFLVTNFGSGATGIPVFGSLGIAGASLPSPGSNASIVAVLPEPTTGLLIGLGLAVLAIRRSRS